MSFSQILKDQLAPLHLLNHPFYKDWNEGKLEMATLKEYSKRYYHHVSAFPRYLSATHSQCPDINSRRILLENLNDEEGFPHHTHHPELWLRFAEGLGVHRNEVLNSPPSPAIENVIQNFFKASYASYEEGLASLYAYEYQVPEVAETKIKGLQENYQIQEAKTLSFFTVHKEADQFHRQACESLLDQLEESQQEKALMAAQKSAQSLWDFLTEMQGVQSDFTNTH